jgi:hypothetical protein
MHFPSASSRWHVQRRITLLGILSIHIAVLWILSSSKQRQIETVQYLSLFNVRPIKKPINETDAPLPSPRNIVRKANIATLVVPEAIDNAPKINIATAAASAPNTDAGTTLNVNSLRNQAVRMELTRIKSDIEKMNDRKKLNLSIEAKLNRELNKIVLPECGAALMGKLMPERMMITQDHSKKKFCQ